jgi:rhodanese-related sulfurtransferase
MFGLFSSKKKYNNINAKEFEEGIKDKNAFVLDVRSKSELADGKIPGYHLIDIHSANFKDQIKALDRSKHYYVYCRSGGRSAMACKTLAKEGFENISNLSGGIMAWNRR